MADTNYVMPPATEVSPGVTLFGIPIIPATPGSANSDFPKLPSLPSLTDIPGVSTLEGIGTGIGKVASGIGEAFNILTNPARVITVIVGVVMIFAGFHLLGNATVADAISSLKKAA